MKYIALLTLLILIACGGTAFDEDYWDDDVTNDPQNQDTTTQLAVNLVPVTSVAFIDADVVIGLNGNSAAVRIDMTGVPENIVQGPFFVTDSQCTDFSPEAPTTGTVETRNFTTIDNGTRASLFASDTTGDQVEGRTFIVYAMSKGGIDAPASEVFPFACGTIVSTTNSGTSTGTTGGTTGTTVGTTVGGTVGTTAGGTTTGTTTGGTGQPPGSVGGGVGGIDSNAVGGATAGSVGGVSAGTVGTTVGGVTGTTTTGTTAGTIGTTFGGVVGE